MAPHEKVLDVCSSNFGHLEKRVDGVDGKLGILFDKSDKTNDKFNAIYWKLGLLCGTMSALGAYLGKH